MTNREVVEAFINGNVGHSLNLTSTGDKLISYNTCIIQMYDGRVIINDTDYSRTTAKQTNYAKNYYKNNWPYNKVIVLKGYPKGTQSLI